MADLVHKNDVWSSTGTAKLDSSMGNDSGELKWDSFINYDTTGMLCIPT